MRYSSNGVLVTVTLAILAIVAACVPGWASTLQYDRDSIREGAWYLLLTGHLTHFGVSHLSWDVAVLLALGIACALRQPGKTIGAIAAAMVLIPLALLAFQPHLAVYRGLSGIDTALFGLLLVSLAREGQAWPWVALVVFIGKLAYECATGQAIFVDSHAAGFAPVPMAHLVGMLCGVAAGLLPQIRIEQRRLAIPAALVLLATTQTGCLTNAMWKRGVPTKLHNPHVVSGKDNGTVIVEYGEGGDTSTVLLPIDRDTLEPLRYSGDARSLAAIEQDVPNSQVRKVKAAVLPSAWSVCGRNYHHAVLATEARNGAPSEKLGVTVFAFDAAGDPVGDVYRLNNGKSGGRFPPDCRIYLLPSTQPREPGPVACDTFVLVIATPLTLLVDCVVTPVHVLSRSPLD